MFSMTFDGEVELDESLFGRKCKYHKGKDTGCKVWIFGIVERSTNRLILYPVDRRNKQTLIPLIKKHVKPGATIFSDGWAAYLTLNEEGFSHFTVSHKTTFRQKMNGVKLSTFESHLCEIVWRNHHSKSNIYQAFFDELRGVYNLKDVPEFTYEHQYSKDTFTMSENEKVVRMSDVSDNSDGDSDQVMSVHAVSVQPVYVHPVSVQSESVHAVSVQSESVHAVSVQSESVHAVSVQSESVQAVSVRLPVQETTKEKRGGRKVEKQKRRSSSLPMTRGRARKKYGCPEGFTQVEKRERCPNPYSKQNFVAFESSDDDFDN
ncbi:unnamed protein product [Mytilus edulis]|uniref:ISXO2-like transposase domain-containing protein n=1 Tax=Mytilus edulis TaxID=6550 RepID=A0A8S3VSG9_MYTED|nr:unnamed protein product [Mytilus edulis]